MSLKIAHFDDKINASMSSEKVQFERFRNQYLIVSERLNVCMSLCNLVTTT
jgi:hypothetical protein